MVIIKEVYNLSEAVSTQFTGTQTLEIVCS